MLFAVNYNTTAAPFAGRKNLDLFVTIVIDW